MMKINPGILYGEAFSNLLTDAKQNGYALPAINVTSTSIINAVLEAAKEAGAPIIIQLSHGGAHFFAGKSLDNSNHYASLNGAISAAKHIHQVAEQYGVAVLIHTDHASRELLPWIDMMLAEEVEFYKNHGYPLFGMHMLDLSLENLEENIATCKLYLERFSEIDTFLELELGVTGGEEDGLDNTNVENSRLYTQPEDVAFAYDELKNVSPNFLIAAAFGNVHGVYAPGNVKLRPEILQTCQEYVSTKVGTTDPKPLNLVFHGSSGSTIEELKEAVTYGVVKVNIDTDMQWAYWEGVKKYYDTKHDYLQAQLGNPEGNEEPNKKYYDPRSWLRAGEQNMVERIKATFEILNCTK